MPVQVVDVKEITSRLDVIIKLMAALFARDLNNIDAIVKLDRMKLSRDQIANALGITTANVAQQLYIAGKKADKPEKKADKTPETAEAATVAEGAANSAEEA